MTKEETQNKTQVKKKVLKKDEPVSSGSEAKVYNREGKEAGKVMLPENLFNLPWNADLVHQVVTAQQANQRTHVAHTKDRSEVSGGGRKPWRQKGTGRARHGSRRSPIWTGGGVTFGPRNTRVFEKGVNKKMQRKAFFTVLSQKAKDGEVLFVDDLGLANPKAKEAKVILGNLGGVKGFERLAQKKKNAAIISTPIHKSAVIKSFANFGNVEVEEARNLSPLALMRATYVIFENPKETLKVLRLRNGEENKE
ncbi:MAG: 50S ribosomal protein L4 [Candidatus Paceibacterota bacterium]